MSLFTFGIPSWLVYLLAIGVVAGGIYGKGRLDQKHADALAAKDAIIADVQAKLKANDEIRRQSDADAARAEAEADRLKMLLETMSNDKSCPLSKSHVDGIGKIDNAK